MLMDTLDRLLVSGGFPDFRWTDGSKIAVAQWVRMKCTFACDAYGRQACCPPNVPAVADCAEFFADYERIAVIHLEKAGETEAAMQDWKKETNARLLALEREVFLAGYYKAVVLFPGDCSLCPDCVTRPEDCRNPGSSRPTPEALAVDVFATARQLGYPLEVLTDRSQTMNRYAFMLVE
jgi:predicted metal-binding protein